MKIDYNYSTTEFYLYSGEKQWNLEEKPSFEMIEIVFLYSFEFLNRAKRQ